MKLYGITPTERWRSRMTFVMALATSAVGLGNFWRFSYLAAENGGALFILTYFACLLLVAVPVMVAELVIGTHGRAGPVVALEIASDKSLVSRNWKVVGLLACLTGLLIISYYMVVAGWSLAYAQKMYSGEFSDASLKVVGQYFEDLVRSPRRLVVGQTLFLMLCATVVSLGVRRGLGLLAWIAIPSILVLLGVLVDYSLDYGDLYAGKDFLFSVKPIDFSFNSVLLALKHAFYTLGIGVGVGICYGAYAPDRVPIGRSVAAVAVFDTLVSLAAGLAIFPLVFAHNLEPSMGPGLLFISMPYAFGNLMQGDVVGMMFFGLIGLVALGSSVALMEPITAYIMQRTGMFRLPVVVGLSGVIWLLGLGTVLSLNTWKDWVWFGTWNYFEFLEVLTADLMLPLVCLLIAFFVGWRMRPAILREQLSRESNLFITLWLLLLRYIVPLAIGLILLTQLLSL